MPLRLALVDTESAAYQVGRSVGTIWRWTSEGRITRHGAGKSARYDANALPHAVRDEDTGELLRVPPAPPLPEGVKAA